LKLEALSTVICSPILPSSLPEPSPSSLTRPRPSAPLRKNASSEAIPLARPRTTPDASRGMSYSYSQQQPSQQQQVQQYQQQQPQYSSQPPQQQQQQPQQSSSQSLYPSSSSTLQKHVPPPAHSMPSAQSEEDPTFGPLERAGKIVGEQQVRDAGLIGDLGDGLQGT
jgi:hypothetical protein